MFERNWLRRWPCNTATSAEGNPHLSSSSQVAIFKLVPGALGKTQTQTSRQPLDEPIQQTAYLEKNFVRERSGNECWQVGMPENSFIF